MFIKQPLGGAVVLSGSKAVNMQDNRYGLRPSILSSADDDYAFDNEMVRKNILT